MILQNYSGRSKRIFLFVLIGLVGCSSIIAQFMLDSSGSKDQTLINMNLQKPSASAYHSPIDIDGNTDLDAFPSKTGFGNSTHPYVIKDLIIDGGGIFSTFIIRNTDKFLILQNITIFDSIDNGLLINNCQNITIESITVRDSSTIGILIENSQIITIESATVRNSNTIGIKIDGSHLISINSSDIRNNIQQGIFINNIDNKNLTLTSNTVYNNNLDGIYLSNSDSSTILISGNNISDNSRHGIYIYSCKTGTNIKIVENIIYNNSYRGIDLHNSEYIQILENRIDSNTQEGIYLRTNAYYNVIASNIIEFNSKGVYLYGSSTRYNYIWNNTMKFNYIGIYLSNSYNNDILENTAVNNYEYGIRFVNNPYFNNISLNILVENPLGSIFASSNDRLNNDIENNNENTPTITNPPDLLFPVTFTGQSITWTLYDSDFLIKSYTIFKNGIPVVGHTNHLWIPSQPLELFLDGIIYGTYNFTLIATDGWGGIAQDEVIVTVTNTPPSITPKNDFSYEYYTTGHLITWTITDTSVSDPRYTIYLNGIPEIGHSDESWSSGVGISINIDGLPEGVHNYTIIVSDGLGRTTEDEVLVTVSNTFPLVTPQNDFSYDNFTTGNTITWTITDPSISNPNYTVFLDSTPVTGHINQPWISGSQITIDIDGHDEGTYNYTIIVRDGLGGVTRIERFVTVSNSIPLITVNDDMTYEIATTGHSINWIVTDPSVSNPHYTIFLDNFPITGHDNQDWVSGAEISITIDDLLEGTHNYTIIVQDGLGKINTEEIFVHVINTHPTISHSVSELIFERDTIGNTFNWTILDPSYSDPRYTVYDNGVAVDSHDNLNWISNISILVNVDGLTEGIHNYTIIVNDGFDAIIQDEVRIEVIDNSAPFIVSSDDILYTQNTKHHSITWIITDSDVFFPSYSIYRNGLFLISKSWTSNIPIVFSVDGLDVGNYNYTIIVQDGWGEISQEEVVVEVVENANPLVTCSVGSIYIYEEGNSSGRIQWNITDSDVLSPTYTIYRDGLLIISDYIPEVNIISLSLDGLNPGNYMYKIIIEDGLGGYYEEEILVTVAGISPTENPLFSISPNVTFLAVSVVGGIMSLFIFIRKNRNTLDRDFNLK